MTMKATLDTAKELVVSGGWPKTVVAANKKTDYSIFDNVPQLVCYAACPVRKKCYDVKILKLRPTVMKARAERHWLMMLRPADYIKQVTMEIAKLPRHITKVRIYGGGDFSPNQTSMIIEVLRAFPDITFYMISKTIRGFISHANRLLAEPNFFLNLSEMADYRFGPEWEALRSHKQVNTVYTLMPDEVDFEQAVNSDIVFNVSKSKVNITKYKLNKLPLCPCDAKDIPSVGACGSCGLCATKGGVKGE